MITGMSRQHRAWVALYSLQIGLLSRNEVLAHYNVTETDLVDYLDSWLYLKVKHQLRQR